MKKFSEVLLLMPFRGLSLEIKTFEPSLCKECKTMGVKEEEGLVDVWCILV